MPDAVRLTQYNVPFDPVCILIHVQDHALFAAGIRGHKLTVYGAKVVQ